MNCMICGMPVQSKEAYKGDHDKINGAVIGDYIAIEGHRQCVQAVNRLVVIPNRIRLTQKPK